MKKLPKEKIQCFKPGRLKLKSCQFVHLHTKSALHAEQIKRKLVKMRRIRDKLRDSDNMVCLNLNVDFLNGTQSISVC